MYRLSARVPKPDNRYDYVAYYFNKYESALDYMKDLLHNRAAETVEIDIIHTED